MISAVKFSSSMGLSHIQSVCFQTPCRYLPYSVYLLHTLPGY